MHLIEVTPVPCMVCGRGNAENRHGERPRFVDLERDTFWEDAAIVCEDCAISIGALVGMQSVDSVRDFEREIKRLKQESHALQAQIDSMKRRARKVGMKFAEEAA